MMASCASWATVPSFADHVPVELFVIVPALLVLYMSSWYLASDSDGSRGFADEVSNLSTHSNKKGALSGDHIETIATRKWKTVLAWVTFHPDELRWVDKRNQTALHHACLFRAPAQVIDMILYQAPELAAVQNEDGEIALHWAVRLGAPNEVIAMLLYANPTSGILTKDKDGNTPLSLFWERYQEQLEDDLWHSGPGIDIQKRNSWKRLMMVLRAYHRMNAAASSHCHSPATKEQDDYSSSMSNSNGANMPPFRPLHVAAQCPCPHSLFRLILFVDPKAVKERDEQGRLPLSCACADPLANLCDGKNKISILLQEYPQAAHIPDPATGRIPLFVALEAGVLWEEGVSDLVLAKPGSLRERDPVSGLHPFQLAAYGARSRSKTSYFEQIDSLSSIYRLLRFDPSGGRLL